MKGGKREGAGRKPAENPLVMYYIRVPQDLKERLGKLGAEKVRKLLDKLTKEREP
jgi:hypothetical protein